jgi:conjugal transfer pilus assembly protein TraU
MVSVINILKRALNTQLIGRGQGSRGHESIIIKLILILGIMLPNSAYANFPCSGHFVNPITDICWSCLLPITIGPIPVAMGGGIKNRDIKNPTSPLCLCTKANIPIPGVAVGFWEPARLVDITRTPYCMTNLGGVQMGPTNLTKVSSYHRGYGKHIEHTSFYHLHYYIYPLIYWLELITDFICLEKSTFDVAYMSEFDITWNDDKMTQLINPEAWLFGNPIAQAACVLDCASATVSTPMDSLFWCAGCWGNMYPLSGGNADHIGGVQNSSLLTTRILSKLHRLGLAQETSTNDSSPNGKLCRKNRAMKIKKSQYKLQMTNPKSTSGPIGCWPLGLSDALYSSFKEYPNDGEDWGYLIWRKKNCCAF